MIYQDRVISFIEVFVMLIACVIYHGHYLSLQGGHVYGLSTTVCIVCFVVTRGVESCKGRHQLYFIIQ